MLGQPSREGFNLIAWIFPILAAVVGIGWVIYLVLVLAQAPDRQPLPARTAAASQDPARVDNAPRKPGEETDDYMKRVERELRETE